MFWLSGSRFLRSNRSSRGCPLLAVSRAFGHRSTSRDAKMNDPVEEAKRLAAYKAVDNHVAVMNQALILVVSRLVSLTLTAF